MSVSIIDLNAFAPKYRQALLFTMVEGLLSGQSFYFLDNRDTKIIEEELSSSDLKGYRWSIKNSSDEPIAMYLIEREA